MSGYIYSGNSLDGGGKTKGSFFLIGRVKSIVLGPENFDGSLNPNYQFPRDIGKITYEILYTNINLSKADSMAQPAYPIFSSIKQFPLVSEIVYIVPGPDSDLNDNIERQGYYYFPPYSLWNSINHNAFPNLKEYSEYVKKYFTEPGTNGSNDQNQMPDLPLGMTFIEQGNVRQLRPFEGDTIIESRFGQSIRFGSTVLQSKTLNNWSNSGNINSPITIIRNGQGDVIDPNKFSTIVEDINRDNASIWLTSGQEININDLDLFPMKSFDRYKTTPSVNPITVPSKVNYNTTKYSYSPIEQDNAIMNG
jgi:hypothetical protein